MFDEQTNHITSWIPSWSVAVFGSFLIVLSTIIGSIFLDKKQSEIESKTEEIVKLEERFRRGWDNHILAEQRMATSEVFAGLISMDISNTSEQFLLPRSGKYARDAILTMYISADLVDEFDNKEAEIQHLVNALRQGNRNAYDKLFSLLDEARLESADTLNNLRIQILEITEDKIKLRSSWSYFLVISSFLNIAGLVIVLLKDLPIWRK